MKAGRFALAAILFGVIGYSAKAEGLVTTAPVATAPATQEAFDPSKVKITFNTTEAPDLDEWANKTLLPVLIEWYPKICNQLPVEGFTPPDHFSVTFTTKYKGVAYTLGTRIVVASDWIRKQINGEALGSIVHEEVHVVQAPWFRNVKDKPHSRIPSWLLEGSCDYIRWFQYEPVEKRRKDPNPDKVKYDDKYFVTADFLVFVSKNYDKNIVAEMNVANHQGTYSVDLWKQYTGKTIDELSDAWKADLRKRHS